MLSGADMVRSALPGKVTLLIGLLGSPPCLVGYLFLLTLRSRLVTRAYVTI